MSKFIALLRGINVSGQKKIKMAELREHLENAGFENVETYIQSGNIVFSSTETNTLKLAKKLEDAIQKNYGYHVPTLVKTNAYFVEAIKNNLFLNDPEKEIKKLSFTFLYSKPTPENIEKFMSYSYPNEEVVLKEEMAYQYSGNDMGKAKITHNFIENKLKVTASSRNYNTVVKLIEMSKS